MTSNASTVKREVISLGTAKAERGPEIDMIEEADLGLQEEIEEMGEEMAIGTEGEETGLQGKDMTTPDLTLAAIEDRNLANQTGGVQVLLV